MTFKGNLFVIIRQAAHPLLAKQKCRNYKLFGNLYMSELFCYTGQKELPEISKLMTYNIAITDCIHVNM